MNGSYRCTLSQNEFMLTEHADVPLDMRGGLIDKKSNHAFLIKFPDLYSFTRCPHYN